MIAAAGFSRLSEIISYILYEEKVKLVQTDLFIKRFCKHITTAIYDDWLIAEDFENHHSCDQSIFHAKLIGLLSYTLQHNFGYYLLHEARPWGRFKADIIAYKLRYNKISPVGIIEYESPNSYLHYPISHIGKDIRHYFEFQDRIISDDSDNIQIFRNVDWYIISTLPTYNIEGKFWRYTNELETDYDITSFRKNPLKLMISKYRDLYSQLGMKCKRPPKEWNPLNLLNLSLKGGKPIIKPYKL